MRSMKQRVAGTAVALKAAAVISTTVSPAVAVAGYRSHVYRDTVVRLCGSTWAPQCGIYGWAWATRDQTWCWRDDATAGHCWRHDALDWSH